MYAWEIFTVHKKIWRTHGTMCTLFVEPYGIPNRSISIKFSIDLVLSCWSKPWEKWSKKSAILTNILFKIFESSISTPHTQFLYSPIWACRLLLTLQFRAQLFLLAYDWGQQVRVIKILEYNRFPANIYVFKVNNRNMKNKVNNKNTRTTSLKSF